MKSFLYFFVATNLTILLLSCTSASTKSVDMSLSPNERIQGSWEVIGATGAMSDLNKGTRYIFQGQDLTTSNGIEIKGQFKVNDSTIIWVLPNMEMNYTYRFEGEQLIIEPLNSGQILTLEKQ